MCVDLILDLSGILIEIGLIAGCKLFTGVTGGAIGNFSPPVTPV